MSPNRRRLLPLIGRVVLYDTRSTSAVRPIRWAKNRATVLRLV